MEARHTALALSAEGQPQERIEELRHGHGREATIDSVRAVIIPVRGIHT